MRRRVQAGLVAVLIAAWAASGCASQTRRPTTVVLDAGATIPPRVLKQAELEVPADLVGGGCRSGTAVLEVEVGATGRVLKARVSRSSGVESFDQACMQAGLGSTYQPATSHGRPTIGTTHIECSLKCP